MKDPEIIWETWREALGYSSKPIATEEERLDQAALEVYLRRMGNAILFCVGSSDAIYMGRFLKLDPEDYSVAAVRDGDKFLLPGRFVRKYIEETADDSEPVDVKAICEGKEYSFCYDEKTGLFAVCPKSCRVFLRETDPGFLDRMERVFHEPFLPRPKYNNTQETRQIIEESYFPRGHVQFYKKMHVNLYTPSLQIMWQDGKKVIYLAYEHNVNQNWEEVSCDTVVKVSYDDGKTYRDFCVIPNMRWAGFFTVKGELYLHGSRVIPSHAVWIIKLNPDGTYLSKDMEVRPWTQANPAIVANHRIYLPTFPMIMSADIDRNLLDPDSWEYSNDMSEVVSHEWLCKATGVAGYPSYWPLEASVVQSPTGELYVTVRLEMIPYNGFMGLMRLSPDGKTLTLDERCNGLVHMPTSVSKVDIKYDPETKLYIGLPNYPAINTPYICGGPPISGQRNILCIAASEDLIHWHMLDILLTEQEVMNPAFSARAHGYQYVEWVFDGEDILMSVREANGYTSLYHDGTMMTLYRLKDYKQFVKKRFEETEVYQKKSI